jgi:hypothetical protein
VNSPDLTKRSNAIIILLALDVFFFICAFVSWIIPHGGDGELWKFCGVAFYGNSQALMLALKMGGPDTPNPPDATSGSATTTTTTTASTAVVEKPKGPSNPIAS